MGASTKSLIVLLLRDCMKWVAVSNLGAWPVAYTVMSRWLQKYAYHTSLTAGVFVSVSCVTLIMALLTVTCQTVRVGLADPVASLRYE